MRQVSFFILMVFLFSCANEKNKPDVSHIQIDFKTERFEQSFFKIDTNNLEIGLQEINKKYPDFFSFYMMQILRLSPTDSTSTTLLKQILSGYSPINDSIQKKYDHLNWLKDELTTAFKYVKYYYPSYKVPDVITFIGTFDAPGIVLTPRYLGIGLHQYAGKNFSAYKELREVYPEYISRRFDKEYIVANSIKAIVDDIYPDSSAARPLIEQMIEKGKQWYLLDKFLPDAADSLKTGYTQKQLNWVKENEGNVWGFFTSNTDFFTIDPAVIQDYIGEGPFTRGMPETSSPGNIGQWVGWQIVKKFAEKKSELSIQQVLATPAKVIFQETKYKPK